MSATAQLKKLERLFANAAKAANTAEQAQKSPTTTSGVQYEIARKKIDDAVDTAIQNQGDLGVKYNQVRISGFPSEIVAIVKSASGGQIDLSEKYIAINGDDVWHEYKRHRDASKETDRRQLPQTPETIKEAVLAIYDPDVVESLFTTTQNPTQKQSFVYAKKSLSGYYIVVEAVGGMYNPNVVPVMILQFSEAKWNDMISAGITLGEVLFENDAKKRNALNIELNKKNRVIVAQFASNEAIASTPHSPRFNDRVAQNAPVVNTQSMQERADYAEEVKEDTQFSLPTGDISTDVKPPQKRRKRKLSKSIYLEKMLSDPAVEEATKAQIRADNPLFDVMSDDERFALAEEILKDEDRLLAITEKLVNGEAITAEETTALIMMQGYAASGAEQANASYITATGARLAGRALRSYNRHIQPYEQMDPEACYVALLADTKSAVTDEAFRLQNRFIDYKFHRGAGDFIDQTVIAFHAEKNLSALTVDQLGEKVRKLIGDIEGAKHKEGAHIGEEMGDRVKGRLLEAMYNDIYEMTKNAFRSMPSDEAVDTVEDYLETVKETETYDPDIINAYATVTLSDGKPLITNKDLCARYKKAVDDVYEKRMNEAKGVYTWTKDGVEHKIYTSRATTEEMAFIEKRELEFARSDIASLFKKVDAATLIAELDRYSADIVRKRLL